MARLVAGFFLASSFLIVEALRTKHASPIKRVISLIQDLDARAVEEGEVEAQTFHKFQTWGKKSLWDLFKLVEAGKKKKAEHDSKLTAQQAESEALELAVQELDAEAAKQNASAKRAADARQEAVELYATTTKDLNSTIDAVGQAIETLQTAAPTAAAVKAASLMALPLVVERLSGEQKAALLSLSRAPPKVKAYESQTGPVIDLLKHLDEEFKDKQHATVMDETEAAGDYAVTKAAMQDEATATASAKAGKVKAKVTVDSDILWLGRALNDTVKDLAADSKDLQDTKALVKLKQFEYKERQYMRGRERKAFKEGIGILAQVSGVHVSVREPTSFVQLTAVPGNRAEVLAIQALREEAPAVKSLDLMSLASELENLPVQAVGQKVDGMVRKQMWQLKGDQAADDKQKHWCGMSINRTKEKVDLKKDEMTEFNDRVTSLKATVATMLEDMEKARAEISASKTEMDESYVLRVEAKSENKQEIKDARKSQGALNGAIRTLQDYYKDALEAASGVALLQGEIGSGAPDTWSDSNKSYTGNSGAAAVIAALEEAHSDYSRMEADLKAQEEADKVQYNKQLKDKRVKVAGLETEIELKQQEKVDLLEKARGCKESFDLTDMQHASLMRELGNLDEQCNGGQATYADRKADRDKELAGLTKSRAVLADAFNITGFADARPTGLLLRQPKLGVAKQTASAVVASRAGAGFLAS